MMQRPTRWTWGTDGGADRVWAELDGAGITWFHDPSVLDAIEGDPFGVAERVLGRRPFRLWPDRLELKPGPHRGYQNTRGPALFHIDPDPYLPPEIQLLACARPAADGGDSTFLDSWELVRAIEAADPALFARLFTAMRTIGFSHNRWFGPTVTRRLDHTMVVHGAMPIAAGDTVGAAVLAQIQASAPMALRLAHGDVLVASNHRLLHGRTAFADSSRLLFRLLLWADG